jgi:hypothetical protein
MIQRPAMLRCNPLPCNSSSHSCLLTYSLPTIILPVRRSTVRSCTSAPSTGTSANGVGRTREARLVESGSSIHAHVGTVSTTVVTVGAVHAIRLAVVSLEVCDHAGEFLLQDSNALLDDVVWLQASDRLDIKVESSRDRVKVERLVRSRGVFPLGIL